MVKCSVLPPLWILLRLSNLFSVFYLDTIVPWYDLIWYKYLIWYDTSIVPWYDFFLEFSLWGLSFNLSVICFICFWKFSPITSLNVSSTSFSILPCDSIYINIILFACVPGFLCLVLVFFFIFFTLLQFEYFLLTFQFSSLLLNLIIELLLWRSEFQNSSHWAKIMVLIDLYSFWGL